MGHGYHKMKKFLFLFLLLIPSLAFGQILPSASGTNSDPSLVGWWPLSEGSGSSTTNYSPLSVGTGFWAATGGYYAYGNKQTWSGYFDGSTNYVNLGTGLVSSASNISVCTWAYPALNTRGDIVSAWSGGANANSQFDLLIGITSGKPVFYISNASTAPNSGAGATSVTLNTWNLICGTYDGAHIVVYLNGTSGNSTASAISLGSGGTSPYLIGGNSSAGGLPQNPYNGRVEQVFIWSRALNSTEISNFYTGTVPSSTSLVGEWLLNEGSGTTAVDSSGNSHTGTWNGTAAGIKSSSGSYTSGFGQTNAASLGGTIFSGIANNAIFNTSTFSLCAWANPSVYPSGGLYQNIVSKAYSTSVDSLEQFGLAIDSNGGVYFQNGSATIGPYGSLTIGSWVQVCGTSDGTTATLYVNGTPVATGAPVFTYSALYPFLIGGSDSNGYQRYFNGLIQDVRYWTRKLTGAQVLSLFRQRTTVTNGFITPIQTLVSAQLGTNHGMFSDSTSYWRMSPSYPTPFSIGLWEDFTDYPSYFTAPQILNIITKFQAVYDGAGHFPVSLNTNATAAAWTGCGGGSNTNPPSSDGKIAAGDTIWYLALLMLQYYQMTGTTTGNYTSWMAQLETAYTGVPRDTNHLVCATTDCTTSATNAWMTFASMDGVQKTGDDLEGSIFYYEGRTAMAAIYTALGNTSAATNATSDAATIAANIASLWDSTDGMFYAASGQNQQIDIVGSVLAYHFGLTTSAENLSISNWLVANIATINNSGFIRMSPSNWANSWQLSSVNQCNMGTGNYDDGYWSEFGGYVAQAIYSVNPFLAQQLLAQYLQSSTISSKAPLLEWKSNFTSTTGYSGYVNAAMSYTWFASWLLTH
jgi:hypothetical protein